MGGDEPTKYAGPFPVNMDIINDLAAIPALERLTSHIDERRVDQRPRLGTTFGTGPRRWRRYRWDIEGFMADLTPEAAKQLLREILVADADCEGELCAELDVRWGPYDWIYE